MSSLQGDPTSQDSVPGVTHPQSPGQSPPELAPGSYLHCLYMTTTSPDPCPLSASALGLPQKLQRGLRGTDQATEEGRLIILLWVKKSLIVSLPHETGMNTGSLTNSVAPTDQ